MVKFVSEKIRKKSGARLACVQAVYMACFSEVNVDEVVDMFLKGEIGRFAIEEDMMKGEEMVELSEIDKRYMKFGSEFEKRFLNQGFDENRSMNTTLELAWDLLSLLPESELDRMNSELIKKHYRK